MHEGVQFPCGECGKAFTSRRGLKEHSLTVHEGRQITCGLIRVYEGRARGSTAKTEEEARASLSSTKAWDP